MICNFDAQNKARALETRDDLPSAQVRARELLNSGAETALSIVRANVEGEKVDLSSYQFYDYLEK